MSGSQIMIVMIVLIVSIAKLMRMRYQASHGIIEDRKGRQQLIARPQDEATKVEMQRELDTLRERVKVLERITTDANSLEQRTSRSIAAEIESLRDK